MEEVWRDIKGYEGRYQVSNLGNVRNLHFCGKTLTTKDNGVRNLKLILNSAGYFVVTLYKNGVGKQCFVHRLVAEAFIPNPENFPIVDHVDTNTKNNIVSNLKWTTVYGNVHNPISEERRIKKVKELFTGKNGVLSNKHRGCIQYDMQGNLIKIWNCMSDAWRSCGIDSGSLTRACQGKAISAGGYKWEYLEEELPRCSWG